MSHRAAITLEDFHLQVAGRVLLENTGFRIERGQLVLLLGLSGSGKSLTLKTLLGLEPPGESVQVSGRIELFGEPVAAAARRCAGIVFQDFGLFDEWSARDNMVFGADHRPAHPGDKSPPAVESLIRELGLEHAGSVASLSGGMKQRTALARTLAFDPEILFYDEPTSGLDPAMSSQVASLIRNTHDEHKKTSVVVTHDLESLATIADRIFLIDPHQKAFVEVNPDVAAQHLRKLAADPLPEAGPSPSPSNRFVHFFERSGALAIEVFRGVAALLPRYPRSRWGLAYLVYYLRLTTLGTAIPYVALCGFMLGLLVTYFTFSFLPFKNFTEPILMDQIISGIGYALYRIMAPAMTALLIAARNGAAVAADIGHRVYSRQTDALLSFGVRPERYLLTNIVWSFLLGAPLLLFVNFICAALAGLVVFGFLHPEISTFYWRAEFDRFLAKDGFFWDGTIALLIKTLISAFGVALIAWHFAATPKSSGRDVSRAVTLTIIWSTLFALLVQLVSAFMEFDPL